MCHRRHRSLNKTGSGTLTLNGVNTYGGGTVLAAGTLAWATAAPWQRHPEHRRRTTLDTAGPMTLGNALSVNGQLNLSGSNPLTLTGNISGTGGLNKNGASTLTLSAATTTPADQPQQRHAGVGSNTALAPACSTPRPIPCWIPARPWP
ncbi:hypothetical protein CSV86_029455 [Pseudomonas putida CSV86]|uniref:Uncharacterized protein n=1 Tax=Pseudomonas bharatica CSV86 TaxID=1005395 RepID=A0A7K4EMU1_9PSED|nr:autotransporter-associated beta strand repeat-containing protein [Pseudomonas bharatica]NNJ18945.1 hypothetical protein [Pseudomonas bharatica CSV86]